ncbi:MAG: DUF1080 domain-containing protein [Bacteroidetes bacterium]|nr:DUF1080 domain-containing protein [Bacteroidota bacterium]MBS1933664.1 DUF1080 domain-containing protein [Bacteroidota bacterium]
MKRIIFFSVAFCSLLALSIVFAQNNSGWISLFDGKTLNGWKAGKNAETFHVDSGAIIVHGNTSHLYYTGNFHNHDFKNFEFKAKVMTFPHANSGIYFHSQYQEAGFPDHGYEVQVNNSHSDDVRTGSLYDIVDVKDLWVKDNEWFTEYIKVQGKRVIVKINNTVVVDYTEPEHPLRDTASHPFRYILHGTFALQGHDPGSVVYFKDIMVRPLP